MERNCPQLRTREYASNAFPLPCPDLPCFLVLGVKVGVRLAPLACPTTLALSTVAEATIDSAKAQTKQCVCIFY